MFRDAETLAAAIEAAIMLGAGSAREAAERTLGRKITDVEWEKAGPRWERAWDVTVARLTHPRRS